MMDLPPLDDTAAEVDDASIRKCSHISGNIHLGRVRRAAGMHKAPHCNNCSASASPWLCLQCGSAHCGRNDAGHAEIHALKHKHFLAISADSHDVWCYQCDDFVVPSKDRNQKVADVKALFRDQPPRQSIVPALAKKKAGQKQKKVAVPMPGLVNLGNTCFFNSVMQCLAYSQSLLPFYVDPVPDSVAQKAISRAFLNLLSVMRGQLQSGKPASINPQSVFTQLSKKYEQYRYMNQQDAHELLRTLLDAVKDEQIPRDPETGKLIPEKRNDTFVDAAFGGKLVSVILCATCRNVSFSFEEFLDLSMSLGDLSETEATLGKKKFNLLAAIRKLNPSVSRRTSPHPSRPSSPLHLLETGLDEAIAQLNLSQGVTTTSEPSVSATFHPSLATPATTPPPTDRRLTEQLFRTLDTLKVQHGAAAVDELKKDSSSIASALTLAKCFESFLGCDVLEGANGLVCDRCNGITDDQNMPPLGYLRRTASEPAILSPVPIAAAGLADIKIEVDPPSPWPISPHVKVDTSEGDNLSIRSTEAEVNYKGAIESEESDIDSSACSRSTTTSSDSDSDFETRRAPVIRIPLNDTPDEPPSQTTATTPPLAPPTAKKPSKLTNGFKRYLLHVFPKTLVLHLKRFERINGRSSTRTQTRKIDAHVAFDELIDIGMYLSPDEVIEKVKRTDAQGNTEWTDVSTASGSRDPNNGVYRLYGVVVHSGSLYGGHYIAFVRCRVPEGVEVSEAVKEGEVGGAEGKEVWICASDTSVRLSSFEEVVGQQAYLLFYEHVDGGF
ncbi:ubiquitin-specific protease ubp2 [Podochytrium sp. JEL0797]|nr:ubiquitin-specific protease ubp2 [Podochytrium sp. JEL0797]